MGYAEWGTNALMYMFLSVDLQWVIQAQICLGLMQEVQDNDEGFVNPYDDDPWSMNYMESFDYAEPRTWNATKPEFVFDSDGMKWYVHMPDWERTLWPFDPGG